MRRMLPIAVCVVALSIAGCQIARYGIYRDANPAMVAVGFDCIDERLHAIPGIENVDYTTEAGGRPLTWSGIKPASTVHRFQFDYQGESMNIHMEEYWDGRVSYYGAATSIEKKGAQPLIDVARPLFAKIETEIQACGFDDLSQSVHSHVKK